MEKVTSCSDSEAAWGHGRQLRARWRVEEGARVL